MDTLEEIELDPDQIEKVYENVENLGIEITGDIEDELEELKVEEEDLDLTIPEGVALDDPVRMYLKEIGKSSAAYPRGGDRPCRGYGKGDVQARQRLAGS